MLVCPNSRCLLPDPGHDPSQRRRHVQRVGQERPQIPRNPTSDKTALIIGASRGLRLALAAEYLRCGWRVVATARGTRPGELRALAASSGGRLTVEELDINLPEQVTALASRQGSITLNDNAGYEVYRARASPP